MDKGSKMINKLKQILIKYNRLIFSSKYFKFSFFEIEAVNKLIVGKKNKAYVYEYVSFERYS